MLKITHEAPMPIGDLQVFVAVREDGTEGFLRESFAELIGMTPQETLRFARFGAKFGGKYAKWFEEKDSQVLLKSGQRGYFVPVDAAKAVISGAADALVLGKVHAQQRHIHERCYQVQSALMGVALTLAIRQATGYVELPSDPAGRAVPLLEKYIRREAGEWVRTYERDVVNAISRVYGTEVDPKTGRQPRFLAWFYDRYVYQALGGKELVDQIRAVKSSKNHKHHQYLTDDARTALRMHLDRLATVASCAVNKAHFKAMLDNQFYGTPMQVPIFWG